MAKQLLLVGDSNVRRYFERLSMAYGTEVDFAQARNASEWAQVLPSCRKGYRIVTYSFMTNIIIDSAKEATTDDDRLDAISTSIKTIVTAMK